MNENEMKLYKAGEMIADEGCSGVRCNYCIFRVKIAINDCYMCCCARRSIEDRLKELKHEIN